MKFNIHECRHKTGSRSDHVVISILIQDDDDASQTEQTLTKKFGYVIVLLH